MPTLFAALSLSGFALTWLWFVVFLHERQHAMRLPPGMLSLYHRERAYRAARLMGLSAGLTAVTTAAGIALTVG